MSARERILVAHVWAVATAIPLLDRIASMKTLLRWMTPAPGRTPYRSVPTRRIVAIVRARLRHPRHMRRRACWRLGLTLLHFLRLAGAPAVLHIGALPPSRDPKRLHAHCWVTLDGAPVADGPRETLAELVTHAGIS